ncbi:hypothetical protein [Catellatospora tritici]|uniref:hypothetical protein n=1 Tax=Catellatospora tritici TaxID=2851566 RepID=UPI001C2D5462|nr:hypothetical protein [Catellatospora tritici]MBV1849619.1 hypothetical protein [Catellatospora tritici]
MVTVDHAPSADTEPTEIADRLLWRDAQQILGRHDRPDEDDHCNWCGQQWPCPPRRLAERAQAAASRHWREAWTVRHDLNGLRSLPGWRADLGERSGSDRRDATTGTGGTRGGYFD